MAELEEDPLDVSSPFHKNNAPGFSMIELLRLYDVGLAILAHLDPEAAAFVMDAHMQGKILGPLPMIDLNDDTSE